MKFKVSEVPEVSAGRCQAPGKYAVKITSAQDAVSSNGNDMTKLVLSVAKGGRKGEVMYTQVMIPNTSDEDTNKIHARTCARFLMSTGLTSKQATSLLMKGLRVRAASSSLVTKSVTAACGTASSGSRPHRPRFTWLSRRPQWRSPRMTARILWMSFWVVTTTAMTSSRFRVTFLFL